MALYIKADAPSAAPKERTTPANRSTAASTTGSRVQPPAATTDGETWATPPTDSGLVTNASSRDEPLDHAEAPNVNAANANAVTIQTGRACRATNDETLPQARAGWVLPKWGIKGQKTQRPTSTSNIGWSVVMASSAHAIPIAADAAIAGSHLRTDSLTSGEVIG